MKNEEWKKIPPEFIRKLALSITVTKFYSLLFQCITKVVPVRRKRFTNTNYPWYNVELRSLKNKKKGLWKKFIRTNNEVDLTNYNKISDAFFFAKLYTL